MLIFIAALLRVYRLVYFGICICTVQSSTATQLICSYHYKSSCSDDDAMVYRPDFSPLFPSLTPVVIMAKDKGKTVQLRVADMYNLLVGNLSTAGCPAALLDNPTQDRDPIPTSCILHAGHEYSSTPPDAF